MIGSTTTRRWFIPVLVLAGCAAVLPGSRKAGIEAAGPQRRPHVVFVTGDDEYRSEVSMPMIAAILEKRHGFETSVAYARPTPQTRDNIEGLEALETADLMVMFTRWRRLPSAQVARIVDFSKSGKPMIGLRTTTHAFQYPDGDPNQPLNDGFGTELFGQRWITHHGHRSTTGVTVHESNRAHPILRGVAPFSAPSWLYHVAPLSGTNTILLDGLAIGSDKLDRVQTYPLQQPVAWTREYNGARVFFTTLGHPGDFENLSMRRLLINAVLWAVGRDIPAGGANAEPVEPYVAPPTTAG